MRARRRSPSLSTQSVQPAGNALSRAGDWCRRHRILAWTVLFALAAVVISCMPMKPINIAYKATFATPVQQGTAVDFTFDRNAIYPEASPQRATVTDNQATINLDPLNRNSRTLSISVEADNVKMQSLIVEISVPKNNIEYIVTEIPGDNLAATTTPNAGNSAATNTPASTFTLSQHQLSAIRKATQQKSAIKAYSLLLLAMLYAFTLARLTMLRNVAKRYFGLYILGAFLVVIFAVTLWVKSTATWQYRLLAGGLALALIVALIVNHWAGTKGNEKLRKALILIDYGGILAFVALQFRLFTRHLGNFPDEGTHLSYIAFMKMHGGWVPDFRAMRIYPNLQPGVLNLADDPHNTFNYLGHPPLYYKLMSLIGGMRVHGNTVAYSETRLWTTSFIIGVIGLLLVMYIGFTRIPHIPVLHLLFGLIVISPANMVYGMSGLSNDTLLLLTVTVFTLGVIRFMEGRYDWVTYLLIAVGFSATILTKLTGGMITATMAVLLVLYTLLVARKPRRIFRPAFYATAPIYLIPIAYFATLFSRLHTIQPSFQQLAPKEFMTTGWYTPMGDRTPLTIAEYTPYFFRRLLDCWSSIISYTPAAQPSVTRPGTTPFTFDALAVTLIFLAPIAVFFFARSKTQRYLSMGTIAILATVLYQFKSGFTGAFDRGNIDGGVQSRYYQCAMAFFALAIIWMITQVFARTMHSSNRAGAAPGSPYHADSSPTDPALADSVDPDSALPGSTLSNSVLADSTPPAPRLSSAGTAFVAAISLLLLYDGFISTFLLSGR
ncbi:MAG: hypothetical protein LKG01_06460 [Bifidobacterium subtile]|nr:hypothetical protein [Bifidobacterium subtile]